MNKKFVIIGGASGIGESVAKKLNDLGHLVVVIGNNLEEIKKISDSGRIAYCCDTAKSDEIKVLVADIQKKYGEIDGLVNCAGMSIAQKKGDFDSKTFSSLMDNNLLNAYNVTHLFGYGLVKEGGSIVNVSSIRGRTGTDSFSPGYAAAKAGVINLTKSYAFELAFKNIRVNCVAPGLTYPTGLSKDWTSEFRENISKTIPLGRLASPSEIAAPILFLLSEDASYITGQTLDVNGGLWMN